MNITKKIVRDFERDQQAKGTYCALAYFAMLIAEDIVKEDWVKEVEIRQHPK